MYRFLIVDDEPYAVEYISQMLSEALEADIYKAYSAEEALEQLSRTRMDILFTDVVMPEMDGFELTRQVLTLWPETRVIILTGHSDFDTLYQSQKMDHVRYLVKTEESSVIVATAQKVIREIEEKVRRTEMEIETEIRSREFLRLRQQEYLFSLLENRVQSAPVPAFFEQLQLEMDADREAFVVAARFKSDSPVLVAETVCRNAKSGFFVSYVMLNTDTFLFLMQPRESAGEEQDRVLLEGTLEMVQDRCFEYLHTAILFAVSDGPYPLIKVSVPVNRLLSMFKETETDSERVLWAQNTDLQKVTDILKALRMLENRYACRDKEGFQELLSSVLEEGESLPFVDACRIYYTLFLTLLEIAHMGGGEKEMELDELFALRPLSWKECRVFLEPFVEALFDSPAADPKVKLITQIEEYVRKNLQDSLSLVKIASAFHYNSSYISRLYQQIRGKTLQSFIMDEKIRTAKLLLRDPSLRIRDISQRLGYETVSYFCFFFKKYTGSTPQEYRGGVD